jgi:CheY-like chemotaxis protein
VGDALAAASDLRQRAEAERESLLKSERAARAAAEAANRSKDEFLAMLGHELRNPLGAISNAAGLLEHEGASEAARRQATQIIGRQVSHLTRLTDDLLDAGRALMGKIVLQRRPIDLGAAAAQSLHTLVAAGRTQRHAVIEDVDPVWVDADPIRLDQIVSNLVINAVKYTPPNGTIRVSVRREDADAVLRVRDDGIGLSPELASRVFDLFVQGDRELDRSLGGLGIGLTLVRRLAEMHGGWASVSSEGPGKGSEFVVRLPAIEKPVAAEPVAPKPAAAASGRDILVIEDNDDARETLCTLLGLSGHRVESAADGVDGLEKALSGTHDIMLVDVGLPRMDGYEVARRIRSADGERRPYLVAVTGYGAPEDHERAMEAGFDAHLVKPVDFGALNEVLARAMASRVPSG